VSQREPSDLFERSSAAGLAGLLTRAHVHGLEEEHARVIAARMAAGGIRSAGDLLGYSESQVRRRWDQIKEILLVPLGLPPHDDALAGLWVAWHRGCCTARVFELLRTDSRFTSRFARDFR
jgi:hypothetical protein